MPLCDASGVGPREINCKILHNFGVFWARAKSLQRADYKRLMVDVCIERVQCSLSRCSPITSINGLPSVACGNRPELDVHALPPQKSQNGIFRRVRFALACRTGPFLYFYAISRGG